MRAACAALVFFMVVAVAPRAEETLVLPQGTVTIPFPDGFTRQSVDSAEMEISGQGSFRNEASYIRAYGSDQDLIVHFMNVVTQSIYRDAQFSGDSFASLKTAVRVSLEFNYSETIRVLNQDSRFKNIQFGKMGEFSDGEDYIAFLVPTVEKFGEEEVPMLSCTITMMVRGMVFNIVTGIVGHGIEAAESAETLRRFALTWKDRILRANQQSSTPQSEPAKTIAFSSPYSVIHDGALWRLTSPKDYSVNKKISGHGDYSIRNFSYSLNSSEDRFHERILIGFGNEDTEFAIKLYSAPFAKIMSDPDRLQKCMFARMLRSSVTSTDYVLESANWVEYQPATATLQMRIIAVKDFKEQAEYHTVTIFPVRGVFISITAKSYKEFYPVNIIQAWRQSLLENNPTPERTR